MPADGQMQIDGSVVSWVLGAMGSAIMLLISIGIKDWREKVRKIDGLCVQFLAYKTEAERDRGELRRNIAELAGDVKRLEQRIEDLRDQ
jgi:hypothetical protein